MAERSTPLSGSADRLGWKRRILWPATILVVALVIWQVEQRRGRGAVPEIESFLRSASAEAVSGERRPLLSRAADPSIADAIVEALRGSRLAEPGAMNRMTITITPGDHPTYGNGSATHHALLAIDGQEQLGLRLVRPSFGGDIQIVGMWRP
jgi:hypothetical protein